MSTPLLLEDASSVRRLEVMTRRLVSDVMAGQYHAVFKGRGMSFADVREYAPGDDIRTIDWNVTARTHVPHVKRYVEERELTVLFAVDVSASTLFGSAARRKRPLAALVTAVLAFSAIRNNDRVGLMLFSDEIELYLPPRKGRGHGLRVLTELLTEPRRTRTDIANALQSLNRLHRRRAVVFLLSDFQQPDLRRALAATSARHDLIALSVVDPHELSVPNVGIVELEDAETGQRVMVDTASARVRRVLGERLAARATETTRLLRSLDIDHIALRTDEDFITPLRAFFERRAARAARE